MAVAKEKWREVALDWSGVENTKVAERQKRKKWTVIIKVWSDLVGCGLMQVSLSGADVQCGEVVRLGRRIQLTKRALVMDEVE